MYDELVKRLREPCQYENCILCQQAADAIKELQGRAKVLEKVADKWCDAVPKWIPVTERLPKMLDGENLSKDVYVTDGAEIAKACIMRDYDGVASWTYTGIGKITHWCEQIPLPEPPKEGT